VIRLYILVRVQPPSVSAHQFPVDVGITSRSALHTDFH